MTNGERHYLISVMGEKIAKLECEKFSTKDSQQCYLSSCVRTLKDYIKQLENEIDAELRESGCGRMESEVDNG